MRKETYFAHRAEDGREQPVFAHLIGTAELCALFASAFGAKEQGQLAGMAHDIGKYTDAFQRRLQGSTEHVDHSTAGAAECYKLRLRGGRAPRWTSQWRQSGRHLGSGYFSGPNESGI